MAQYENHHYVPIWYQKNFLSSEQGKLWMRDLSPDKIIHPKTSEVVGNTRELYNSSPSVLFCEEHLYSLPALGEQREFIEKHYFGRLDKDGRHAFDAVLNLDNGLFHKYARAFFFFIDALMKRTPKGLKFLSKIADVKGIDKSDLPLLMRQLSGENFRILNHCKMEIIWARESHTKFIFSDHPITVYNKIRGPSHPRRPYELDAHIFYSGSIVILPMSPEACLLFYHPKYASNPKGTSPLSVPKYATHYGDTYLCTMLTGAFGPDKKRELTEEEVRIINYIIKSNAHRYLASGNKEWLYPEKQLPKLSWPKLYKTILPAPSSVAIPGDIMMGYKNGSVGGISPDGEFLGIDKFHFKEGIPAKPTFKRKK